MGDGRVSRHLELERKLPQYCLLHSTVFSAVLSSPQYLQHTRAQPLVEEAHT